jgi:hypothetical protein
MPAPLDEKLTFSFARILPLSEAMPTPKVFPRWFQSAVLSMPRQFMRVLMAFAE